MMEYIRTGRNLFHKYLGYVTVTKIRGERIEADTGSRGVLEFAIYDFGKVLFVEKEHATRLFESNEEYKSFCEEDRRIKSELEEKETHERERLRQKKIEEVEREKELDLIRQSIVEENEKIKLEHMK